MGIGFDPVLVIGGAAAQHLLVHRRNADDLTKEVHHLLGPRQGAQITVNDNAIEAVINKNQQIAEQLDEGVHGKPRDAPKSAARKEPRLRPLRRRPTPGRWCRLHLADEIRYIQRRAADHDGRVVTIGQLVLFSSETGDAWLIDRDDRLALRLGSQGDPEPFHIEETDTSFAIDWKGHYRIEGPAFVYTDRDSGRTTTVLGYPTDLLAPQE